MIVGVDPGTTVGWAVIDWDGNLIAKASQNTLDALRSAGVELVVCAKLPERMLPFAVVQKEEVIEGESVVLVRKAWLEEKRSSKEVLRKVIEEYQLARSVL